MNEKNKTNLIVKFLKKIRYLLFCIFNKQFLHHQIGNVNIPFSTKPYLKRSFAQQGEDLVLDRIITRILKINYNDNSTNNYIDIGGFHALENSVTYLLYLRGWSGLVFDASKETEKSFRRMRPRDAFVRKIVGEEDGVKKSFYIHKKSENDKSSINTKYPSDVSNYNKVEIEQVNLQDEIKRRKISTCTVLNIDVEGAECEILKSIDFTSFAPKIIVVEVHSGTIEKLTTNQITKLLKQNYYDLVASTVITHFFVRKI